MSDRMKPVLLFFPIALLEVQAFLYSSYTALTKETK